MSEVEKKFRLLALPPKGVLGDGVAIQQGYLVNDETELRVRRYGEKCYITVKGDGTLVRDEWECEIPATVFQVLWPHAVKGTLAKTRYAVQHGPWVLEIDEYSGRLAGLFTLECEFPDETAARDFVLPSWAPDAEDVTGENAYKNRVLADRGMPA